MTQTLPATLSVPDAALLIGMPVRTLYDQIAKGTDAYGAVGTRVPIRSICEKTGLTRDEVAALLDEMKAQTETEDAA